VPLYKTRTAVLYGVEALPIDVEVDLYQGQPGFFVTVGLPDTAVRESRERIKSSLVHSGFGYPNKAITINLAPANIRKEGTAFDLPIALGILGAMGSLESGALSQYLVAGELSLDGSLRPIRSALPMAICARNEGVKRLVVPAENAAEAAMVEGVEVFGFRHLTAVAKLFSENGSAQPQKPQAATARSERDEPFLDFSDVRGQETVKRSMEGGRRRRPQHPAGRPSRVRQDHAGQTPAGDPSGSLAGRGAGDNQSSQRRRHPQTRQRITA